ncbi:type II toxin-antitoxin system YafQ family toxin [Magnetococcus marinus]|uniref:type II toxin-antitoxin system YafQ family toxin n=1 Tax=Magnetococcus marinus TaxID=1124597 RepID=UPI001D120A25
MWVSLNPSLIRWLLENPLPADFVPHRLTGNWDGCWECHIESDWLLIWVDEQEETIILTRLGTHSDLFG